MEREPGRANERDNGLTCCIVQACIGKSANMDPIAIKVSRVTYRSNPIVYRLDHEANVPRIEEESEPALRRLAILEYIHA